MANEMTDSGEDETAGQQRDKGGEGSLTVGLAHEGMISSKLMLLDGADASFLEGRMRASGDYCSKFADKGYNPECEWTSGPVR